MRRLRSCPYPQGFHHVAARGLLSFSAQVMRGSTFALLVFMAACLICGGTADIDAHSGTRQFSPDSMSPTISELVATTFHPKSRNLRPLPPNTPCDAHGYQGKTLFSSRMKRSLDFQLCKRTKGDEYCDQCKCTWTYYWEAAQLCFRLDPEFKARVFAEKQQWDDDSLLYCNRQTMEYSLDKNSPDFCGALGVMVKPTLFSVFALVLASLLTS